MIRFKKIFRCAKSRLGRKYGPRSNPPKLETWNKPPESHGDTRALSSNRPPR